MPTRSENRQSHVEAIISKPLEIIESEHGLTGLDHVLEMVQARRMSAISELEQQRERDLK